MNERLRLKHLCTQDGLEAAKEWARSTANLYQQSIGNSAHFASQPEWKPRFERVICELTLFAYAEILPDISPRVMDQTHSTH